MYKVIDAYFEAELENYSENEYDLPNERVFEVGGDAYLDFLNDIFAV